MGKEFVVYKYEISLAEPMRGSIEDEIDPEKDLKAQLLETLHATAMSFPFRYFPTVEMKITECEDIPELVGLKVNL